VATDQISAALIISFFFTFFFLYPASIFFLILFIEPSFSLVEFGTLDFYFCSCPFPFWLTLIFLSSITSIEQN